MPTEAEISKIIELHESGKSQREIADEIGKSQPTINNWIKDLIKKGLIRTDQSRTKNANQARREYCAEKRIALIDAGMKKLEEMLPDIDKPSGMRDWFVALGTAIDKRRLEDPEKDREEDALEKLINAIDSHAEAIVSSKASGSVPGLPENSPNLDVRVGEERKD